MAQAKIKMMAATHQNDSGFSAPQITSGTFIQGAPVKISSGNLVVVAAATVGSLDYPNKSSFGALVGISGGKAVSGITTNILVHKFKEGMEFIGNLVDTVAASAVISKIGSLVYMAQASGDTHWGWSLNSPGASNSSYIAGLITRLIDPASTVNGRVQAVITQGGAMTL